MLNNARISLTHFEQRPRQIFGSFDFLKSTAHPEINYIITAFRDFITEDSRVGSLVKLKTMQFTAT